MADKNISYLWLLINLKSTDCLKFKMTKKEFDSDSMVLQAMKTESNLNAAISFLYKVHYDMLENIVKVNSGNMMDAQDVIQETMITFIEMVRENKFRGESSIKSILYTITKNIWISKIRKTKQENLRIDKYGAENNEFEEDVSIQLQKREAKTLIEGVFNKIGESCKKILTMFYYEELSFKDILEKTDYENEQVLRNKKYKCMKSLTDLIELSPNTAKIFKNSLDELK